MANVCLAIIVINMNDSNDLIKCHRVDELSKRQANNSHKTLCLKGLQIGSEETENDISTPVENERKQKYLYLHKK